MSAIDLVAPGGSVVLITDIVTSLTVPELATSSPAELPMLIGQAISERKPPDRQTGRGIWDLCHCLLGSSECGRLASRIDIAVRGHSAGRHCFSEAVARQSIKHGHPAHDRCRGQVRNVSYPASIKGVSGSDIEYNVPLVCPFVKRKHRTNSRSRENSSSSVIRPVRVIRCVFCGECSAARITLTLG